MPSMPLYRAIRAPALAATLVGISTIAGCGSDAGTQSTSADRIVAGLNLTELSASPTAAEIAAVFASWQGRDVSAKEVREEAAGRLSGSTGTAVRVLSHLVDGDRHVGAVVAPVEATEPLPVLFYAHFGDEGVAVEGALLLIPIILGARVSDYVIAMPSFRPQTLTFDGVGYRSEGEFSPWVGEVDDGLAFLNAVLATTPAADPERIVVFGMSSGGANGLLMAIRDARIDGVVDFFGPTDFLGPFVMDMVEDALLGERLRDLPGIRFLQDELVPRTQRGELTLAEVRHELLLRSPLYFIDRLPPLQIHHGTADDIVPLSQSARLHEAIVAGANANGSEYYEYEGGGHHPIGLAGSQARVMDFLQRLVVDDVVASR